MKTDKVIMPPSEFHQYVFRKGGAHLPIATYQNDYMCVTDDAVDKRLIVLVALIERRNLAIYKEGSGCCEDDD